MDIVICGTMLECLFRLSFSYSLSLFLTFVGLTPTGVHISSLLLINFLYLYY